MTAPRHDPDLEQAVLGAMLQDPTGDQFDEITDIITAADFYKGRHRDLYTAMTALRDKNITVDPITVAQSLEPADLHRLGGANYLHDCMRSAPLTASGGYYARMLRGHSIVRAAQDHSLRTAQWASTYTAENAAQLIDRIQADAAALALGGRDTDQAPTWDTLAADAVDEMVRIQDLAAANELPGVPTGWSDLDKLLSNLQGGQVIVIAGRPGSGKSVTGRGIAQHNAMRRNMPALLFSLEMSARECAMAFISAGAGIPLHAIRSGHLDDMQWTRIARYLADTSTAPLMVDDTPGASLAHARTVMRRQIRTGRKPGLLIWDYLQLTDIAGYDGRRQEGVSALSRGFKLLAKEFDIPVVLISQLNRGPEQRSSKRPELSDLRESGSIEQDADIVILLHRDDYYDKESPRAGEIDLIVAKNRHGSTDTVTLAAQLHLQRLMDMAIV